MKKKWTKKEILKLKNLSKVKTFRDIYLCGRTYNAIRSMAIKLNIKSIYKPSEETKKLEIRNKISDTLKRLGLKPPSPRGRVASLKTLKKMSESHKGEKCHFWKGGISTYERKKWLNLQRHYKKKGNGGWHTQEEWNELCKKWNNGCACCKRKIKLTIDHIIPVSKGGNNSIENIQPLCQSCNSKKYLKIIKYYNE